MRQIARIAAWFVALVVLLPLCSCKPQEHRAKDIVIKLGVVGPFEGSNAHIGEMIMNSVKLYFRENPIPGVRVDLVPVDCKSNPPDAVAALQAVAPDQDIVGLIAFYHSSTALAGKPIIQEAHIPTLIYSASNPTVTDNAPYYFRLVPTDDNQAVVLADYARELGAKKVGILYHADEYGKGLSDGFQNLAKANGLEIVSAQSYDATTVDFRPMLTVLKSKRPDVIVICGFVEKSIAILNQAAERQIVAKFLAGDGTFNEEQLVRGAGQNAEGVYVAAPYVFDDSNPKNRAFLEAYWKECSHGGKQQKPASWAAFAYDASGILADALRAGHYTRESIYKYCRSIDTKDRAYNGITGLTYFGPQGNAVGRKFRLAVVRNGKFEVVK
jgi:branched-chain amino acid transport system substrate-binding protein